jgi:hypothetical protein
MNARRLMYKLQNALCAKGIHVRINIRQSWSDKAERMISRYIIVNDDVHKTIIETYQPVEVVKALAELLVGGDGK